MFQNCRLHLHITISSHCCQSNVDIYLLFSKTISNSTKRQVLPISRLHFILIYTQMNLKILCSFPVIMTLFQCLQYLVTVHSLLKCRYNNVYFIQNHYFCQTLFSRITFCIIKVPHINSFMYNYYTNATNELFQ